MRTCFILPLKEVNLLPCLLARWCWLPGFLWSCLTSFEDILGWQISSHSVLMFHLSLVCSQLFTLYLVCSQLFTLYLVCSQLFTVTYCSQLFNCLFVHLASGICLVKQSLIPLGSYPPGIGLVLNFCREYSWYSVDSTGALSYPWCLVTQHVGLYENKIIVLELAFYIVLILFIMLRWDWLIDYAKIMLKIRLIC